MWKYTNMVDGFYINIVVTGRAFLEPCLSKVAALRSPTFDDLLNDGEGKSLKTWRPIFWHLTNKAKEADTHTPVRGGWARDGADSGLLEFTTAMKTPRQVAFNSLNLPKQARHGDKDGEDGIGEESLGSGTTKRDSQSAHLRMSSALVKGELGSRSTNAQYTTVHRGLQGVHTALTAFDKKLATKASTTQVNGLVVDTNTCYDKSVEACKAVVHLVTLRSISKVAGLEHEL